MGKGHQMEYLSVLLYVARSLCVPHRQHNLCSCSQRQTDGKHGQFLNEKNKTKQMELDIVKDHARNFG